MAKKFSVKAKNTNKVKQSTLKAGGKKQKFNKAKKSKVSPKMMKNTSFDSKRGKNKVTFANDSQNMRTPKHQKNAKSPNSSLKNSVNSRKSLVSERKATPFPHSGKIKVKKALPVEEEDEGSDEMDISQSEETGGSESDVSFDELDSFSGDSDGVGEEISKEGTDDDSEEVEVKAPPKVAEKKVTIKKTSNSNTPVTKGPKAKETQVQQPEAKKAKTKGETPEKKAETTPKQVEDKAVKRKREKLSVNPSKKPVKMTAEEYAADNDIRRLFVTNLPENVTDDEVRSLNPQIRDFVMLCAYRKRKGSAILVFSDESAAEKAKAEMTGKKLRGKDLVVDFVGEKNSRKDAKSLGPIVPTRLYIGNIGEHCTEENLREIFVGATVVSVPSQKRHTFGFVEFGDAEAAMEALVKNNYSVYKGEKMIVQFARAKVEEKSVKLKEDPAKSESKAKRMKVEENVAEDEDDGEDIEDEDSDEEEESDGEEESEEEGNSDGGDDLESFDDESD